MIFNRHLIKSDRKVLHKVKKNWVVIPVALLSMLGGAGLIHNMSVHAATPQNSNGRVAPVSQNSNIQSSNSQSQQPRQTVSKQNVMSSVHAPQANNVTVNYINQHGMTVGSKTANTTDQVDTDPTKFEPVPNGYSLDNNENMSEMIKSGQKTYNYDVTGNQIDNAVSVNLVKQGLQGDKYADPTWQKVNFEGPVAKDPEKTISVPVSGRVGDYYAVNTIPASDVPQGYYPDVGNQPIVGTFTPNGINQSVGTFKYEPAPASIEFNFVNANNYAVMPSYHLSGHVDDAGLISNFVTLPKGYHFDDGDSQTFRMMPNNLNQVMDLRINGDQFTPNSKYSHQISVAQVDKQTGKTIGNQTLSINYPNVVHYGDVYQVTVDPRNFAPTNYVADSSPYTAIVRFDPNGVEILDPSQNIFKSLDKIHFQFNYLQSNGAQATNRTNLALNYVNNPTNSASGTGANQLTDITIRYVDQHGKELAKTTKAVDTGRQNLTQLLNVPNGYTLDANQNTNVNVPAEGGQYVLNTVGNQVSGTVSVTLHRNTVKNDPDAPANLKDSVISVPVSGHIGDTYSISTIPSGDIPVNYVPDKSNRVITGQFTKDGLTIKSGTFSYDPKPAQVIIYYVNNRGSQIMSPTVINTYANDSGSALPYLRDLSSGYTYQNSDPMNFNFTNGQLKKTFNKLVLGDLIHPNADYDHTVVFGLVEKQGNQMVQIGTANMIVPIPDNVRLGDSEDVTVDPTRFASNIYEPVTQVGSAHIVFAKSGIQILNPNTDKLVNPNTLSLEYAPAGTSESHQLDSNASSQSLSPSSAGSSAMSSVSSDNISSSESSQISSSIDNNVSSNSASAMPSSSISDNISHASSSSSAASTPSNSQSSSIADPFESSIDNFMSLLSQQTSGESSSSNNDNDVSINSTVDSDLNLISTIGTSNSFVNSSSNSVAGNNGFIGGMLNFVGPNGNIIGQASIGGYDNSVYQLSMNDPAVSQNLPKGYRLAEDVIQSSNAVLKSGQKNDFNVDVEPIKSNGYRSHVSDDHAQNAPLKSIILLRSTYLYKRPTFSKHSRLFRINRNSILNVLGVRKSRQGYRRYKVRVNGKTGYITAHHGIVENAEYSLSEVVPNSYVRVITHKMYSYQKARIRDNYVKDTLWRNQVVKVDHALVSDGYVWLQLSDGHYILANKGLVRKLKL